MIDIHVHILPGVDDGAEDIYETLEMARMAADTGIKGIVATPHCNIPGMYGNYFGDSYIEVFKEASSAIRQEGIPITLYPGMEVFVTEDLPELITDGMIMPLNQSRYILVEFAFDEDPDFATDMLRRIKEVRAKPVIAHAERYEFIKDNPGIAYQWRRSGYVIQINRASFLGKFGERAMDAAYQMLRHNLVSVVASDAHSSYARTPYLLDAYEELSRDHSQPYMDMLFSDNPSRICNNRPILKAKEIPFSEYEI